MKNKELQQYQFVIFEKIRDHYVWLKSLWDIYREIFENDENLKIAQTSAKMFFYNLNIMIIHQIVLNSCKITDEYKKGNLVLGYFMELDEFKNNKEIDELYRNILKFRKYLLKARNKIIAHNDFGTIMQMKGLGEFPSGEDKVFFENIEKFLNCVCENISGEVMGEIYVNCQGDVRDLLQYLKYGINMERMLDEKKNLDERMDIDKHMNMEI